MRKMSQDGQKSFKSSYIFFSSFYIKYPSYQISKVTRSCQSETTGRLIHYHHFVLYLILCTINNNKIKMLSGHMNTWMKICELNSGCFKIFKVRRGKYIALHFWYRNSSSSYHSHKIQTTAHEILESMENQESNAIEVNY